MNRWIAMPALAAISAVLAASAAGQEYLGEKDFLTEHEVRLIRQAQEPNERIQTYLQFAALRIELVRQLLAKDAAGRGAKVHENLDQYGRIIEAVDMVVDDALLRDASLEETMPILSAEEQKFLAALKQVQDAEYDDLWRYEFVLEDAVDVTSDSLELAGESLDERKREVLAADDAERAAREETMSEARRKDVKRSKGKQKQVEQTFERKRPSLLKPGEKAGDKQ